MTTTAVLPHNAKPAATWNAGGQAYDQISETIADAIDHCVLRLAPKPGERMLDVATGTGWTARRVAARGATVTGIDLGSDLIGAATSLARDAGLTIDFKVGDAESLDFPDAAFDAVASTFGVMFVSRPEAAAAELARVVKKGGRLGLVTWAPSSTVAEIFKVMRPYIATALPAPVAVRVGKAGPRAPAPRERLRPPQVRDRNHDHPPEERRRSLGPLRDGLRPHEDPGREPRARAPRGLEARLHRPPREVSTELGLAMPREYMVIIGQRR